MMEEAEAALFALQSKVSFTINMRTHTEGSDKGNEWNVSYSGSAHTLGDWEAEGALVEFPSGETIVFDSTYVSSCVQTGTVASSGDSEWFYVQHNGWMRKDNPPGTFRPVYPLSYLRAKTGPEWRLIGHTSHGPVVGHHNVRKEGNYTVYIDKNTNLVWREDGYVEGIVSYVVEYKDYGKYGIIEMHTDYGDCKKRNT